MKYEGSLHGWLRGVHQATAASRRADKAWAKKTRAAKAANEKQQNANKHDTKET